jgi:hypothetical protein
MSRSEKVYVQNAVHGFNEVLVGFYGTLDLLVSKYADFMFYRYAGLNFQTAVADVTITVHSSVRITGYFKSGKARPRPLTKQNLAKCGRAVLLFTGHLPGNSACL